MFHDADLPDLARSLSARRAMLAESLSDLADARPLIALTVGQTLVADHGPETAARIAQGILDEVGRASERQARAAFAAEIDAPDADEDISHVAGWLTIAAVVVVLAMFAVLARAVAADAIEQRDLYRALGDAAPAFQVMQ